MKHNLVGESKEIIKVTCERVRKLRLALMVEEVEYTTGSVYATACTNYRGPIRFAVTAG